MFDGQVYVICLMARLCYMFDGQVYDICLMARCMLYV